MRSTEGEGAGAARTGSRTLALAAASVPVTWPFGLEQIVPPLVILGGGVWLLGRHRRVIRLPRAAWAYIVFLGLTLLPVGRVAGMVEWLVYLRFEAHLVVGGAVLLLAAHAARGAPELAMRTIAVFAVVIALSVIVFLLGVLQQPFRTGAQAWLPEGLQASRFVDQRIVHHRLGREGIVSDEGWIEPPRAQSFFLEPSKLGAAALPLLAVCLALRGASSVRSSRLGAAGAAGAAVALVASGTRLPIVGAVLVFGGVWGVSRLWRRWGRSAWSLVGAILVVLSLGATLVPVHDGRTLVDLAVTELRPFSIQVRAEAYQRSVEGLRAHPWIGNGTQQVTSPAGGWGASMRRGTGSEYLNVAYRFGALGLLGYLAIWAVVLWESRRPLVREWRLMGARGRPAAALWLATGAISVGLNALLHGLQWDVNLFWLSVLPAGFLLGMDAGLGPDVRADGAAREAQP